MHCHISYRDSDSEWTVRRMCRQLLQLVPEARLSQTNWHPKATQQAILGDAKIVLAVIGPKWLREQPSMSSLLKSPKDPIRMELFAARACGVPIVPVLVEGASIPGKNDLPPELAHTFRKGGVLRHDYFQTDLRTLVAALQRPNEQSPWAPTSEYGTIQIVGKQGGVVARYLETEHSHVKILIDGVEAGVMHLVGETFEQDVEPREHTVVLESGSFPRMRCELRVSVRPGQISVLKAGRQWLLGTLSLDLSK